MHIYAWQIENPIDCFKTCDVTGLILPYQGPCFEKESKVVLTYCTLYFLCYQSVENSCARHDQ